MSKDIRLYFQAKKPQKPKVEEDDDVIPESPDIHIKNKKKETKKKRVIKDSDSEEEIFATKKKKNDPAKSTKQAHKSPKQVLKEIKAVDIFGSGPIKRTEPLVKKQKKTEIGIHSDDELEKSLLEIDNAELEAKTDKSNDEPPISKKEPSSDSKINGKAKNDDKSPSKNEKPSTSEEKKNKSKAIEKSDKKHDTNSTDTKKVIKDEKKNKTNDANTKHDEKKHRSHAKDSKDMKKDIKDERKHKSNDTDSRDTKKDEKKSKDTKLGIKEQVKLDNKRKFSEFVENENNYTENGSGKKKKLNDESKSKSIDDQSTHDDVDMCIVEDHDKGKHKKNSFNKTLNDSVLTDEERHERRRHSAALYKNYLNRSGPKHLGAKEIPEGSPNCLKDCAFVLTGVLDSFEKDEISAVITQYGGAVKSGVSKKVTHVLAGDDAGPAKIAKANELGIKVISEDDFLKMIVNLSKKGNDKHDKEVKKDKSLDRKSSKDKISPKDKSEKHDHVNNNKKSTKSPENSRSESKLTSSKNKADIGETKSRGKSKSPRKIKEEIKTEVNDVKVDAESSSKAISASTTDHDRKAYAYMWVDKYKPQNVKQIIGQHGDASNVKKLTNWLTKWYVNRKAKLPKPSPWAKGDDGGYFKAALLSGPPGVGKTTTVSLVCKELGFDTVEFNASDTRNKTLIKEQIGELLTTTSLSGYAKGDTGKQAVTKKHVLVMDEVDGMAGNEDRGGLQELIGLIKNTSVPIICMCNDRNSQKMRSLVNYCYDLRFSRPRVDQIKSAMMSICFKEGIKIPPDVLSRLIVSANQDVRQTLNLLSLWAVDTDVEKLKRDANGIKKDVKLGPWEAIRKVFSAEEHKTMSINDKSDLFFYDYSLAPLFVQENYLQVAPHCPKHEVLQRISRAADSISLGDLVSARIRGSQAWNLLPMQAMYSSVIPGHELAGHVAGQVQFPGWLGKNSRANKLHRLCQEIHAHTRLSTSGSKSSIYLDYCTHLRDAIVNPLIKDRTDGIPQSLAVLESYHLLREDLDSLVELSVWPGQRNPTVLIDAKVKAAMTRTYNKKATALPYAPGAVKRGATREHGDGEEGEGEDGGPGEDEPEDSDPENDALIKKKKDKDTEKPTTSKSKTSVKPSTSKEKKKK